MLLLWCVKSCYLALIVRRGDQAQIIFISAVSKEVNKRVPEQRDKS